MTDTPINNDDTRRQEAVAYVQRLKAFYRHLSTYLVFNIIFFLINWIQNPGHWWFYWIALFWGIAIVIQAVSLFIGEKRFGKNWENRKINEYLDK